MTDYPQALADLLASVQRPGGFHVAGSFDIHPPRLEVEGVGPIALPLLPAQAEALVAGAEQAPYGRGSETRVDTDVRRTWQVDAARVKLTGRKWLEDLAGVVEQVRVGLAVAGTIEAQLYKLLIYDTGSFFVPHRDTEKAPGMFGTLVVVLPCDYSGGELIIRHRGEEVRVDLHRDEPSEAAFAAFYADCRHEVLPIASGYRLALIYNLIRVGEGPLPQAPDYGAQQTQLTRLLAEWDRSGSLPDKLVYPLEHAYTEAEIGFSALKGQDAAAAQVLIPAAAAANGDLYLALLSVNETGWAEYSGGGHWRDPEFEIGEVSYSAWTLHDWRLADGSLSEMAELPFTEQELSPADALADLEDAEVEFSEATGNEGASFERFYQRAAFVLWPSDRRGAVLAAGGLGVSLPALRDLVRRWEAAGAQVGDAGWREAQRLASAIRAQWSQGSWLGSHAGGGGQSVELLDALLRLNDVEGAVEFTTERVVGGAYGPEDNPALAALFCRLPLERAAGLLAQIIAAHAVQRPGACANLLSRCAAESRPEVGVQPPPAAGGGSVAQAADSRAPSPLVGEGWGEGAERPSPELLQQLQAPARLLLQALPDGRPAAPPVTPSDYHYANRPEPLTPPQLAELITVLGAIDTTLADQAVARLLAQPALYDLDRLLVPAAVLLNATGGETESPAVKGLREAALAHLKARIALPLEPPPDWIRTGSIACQCAHCRALSRFLAAPDQPVWQFKANEVDRQHVAHSIQRAQCDLDLATNKRGRPYTLVCTKNQASFQSRVRQREQDLGQREQLVR
jgi:predicted 2-oxoglutarate/Fe(II)-dependent dioxygenase YbiX